MRREEKSRRAGEAVRRLGWPSDERGVLAVKLGLLMPVLVLIIGSVIDQASYLRQKSLLQGAADAAAFAAAKELSLTDTKKESLQSVVEVVVENYLEARLFGKKVMLPHVIATYTSDPIEVQVTLSNSFVSRFGDVFGLTPPGIESSSAARVIGRPNICVLGLNARDAGTISLENAALVTGQNCAVYSNSDSSAGIVSKGTSRLSAAFICSRGGTVGIPGALQPAPLVDCPGFDDPLADRPEPASGACDPARPTQIRFDAVLAPGTYCGLEIGSGARVELQAGVFVIKNAPLVVKGGASLTGDGAGLYFTGDNAYFTFERDTTISLKAPASGPMAGLLVFASRLQSSRLTYSILSNDARTLIGTIYIPRGELRIDASNPIADQSAYTAIVADAMRLYGGPHLILNTNYDLTTVPVPNGIRGAGQPVTLVH